MKRSVVAAVLLLSASAAYGDIYTWKDARGVAHFTNSLHEIPAKYLRKARVLDVATGKLGGLATAQPAQKAQQGSAAASAGQSGQSAPAGSSVAAPAAPASAVPSVAAPAAVASPASPARAPSGNALPPPTRDAQRRMNRVRARTGGPREEE